MNRFLIPFGLFIALVILLAVGLKLDPREVPSPLIGKPAPAFSLPQLHATDTTISVAELKGKVWILNVWASWCVACRSEHPLFVAFARQNPVTLVGLNYKDERTDALRWLQTFGDPYTYTAVDHEGRAGLDWGVYGVPETFVIDKQGVIRYKQIGAVTQDVMDKTIVPLLHELEALPG